MLLLRDFILGLTRILLFTDERNSHMNCRDSNMESFLQIFRFFHKSSPKIDSPISSVPIFGSLEDLNSPGAQVQGLCLSYVGKRYCEREYYVLKPLYASSAEDDFPGIKCVCCRRLQLRRECSATAVTCIFWKLWNLISLEKLPGVHRVASFFRSKDLRFGLMNPLSFLWVRRSYS